MRPLACPESLLQGVTGRLVFEDAARTGVARGRRTLLEKPAPKPYATGLWVNRHLLSKWWAFAEKPDV